MTSKELYQKIVPLNVHNYSAQLTTRGLETNLSTIFTTLIKDAARCNSYSSDVYYDLCAIDTEMKTFDKEEEFEPMWFGFRKLGVDGTSFVLCRLEDNNVYASLSRNYFALYSLDVRKKSDDWFDLVWSEYAV